MNKDIQKVRDKVVLEGYIKVNLSGQRKRPMSEGGLTIVNAKTGKRLVYSKKLTQIFESSNYYYIYMSDDSIIIMIGAEDGIYASTTDGRVKIYSSELVEKISEHFDLDYSNRTCITFNDITVEEINGDKVVKIKVIPE